jgi:phi13 family phage major tail protein
MATEFRGCSNLVYAPVTTDNNLGGSGNGYVTGDVKPLAPLGEISKAVGQSSATKYYDNLAAVVIQSKGSDTVTLTVAVVELETLAEITGQYYDADTGAISDGSTDDVGYFALGYKLKETDGSERYVWRYKGTFSIPDEAAKSEDDGTDSTNQSVVYTGINTEHVFTKGGSAKALGVDSGKGLADLSTFFDEVTTIDTLEESDS